MQVSPGEQVEGHVGSKLVEGPGLVSGLQASGQRLDVVPGRSDPVRFCRVDAEVGGVVRVGEGDHLPIVDTFLECGGGAIRVVFQDQTPEPGPKLPGGQLGGIVEDPVQDRIDGLLGQVAEGMVETPDPTGIEQTGSEAIPDPAQSGAE